MCVHQGTLCSKPTGTGIVRRDPQQLRTEGKGKSGEIMLFGGAALLGSVRLLWREAPAVFLALLLLLL